MKVLLACEFSGVVRDAFIARGHNAWSVDYLPSESIGPHIQGDVLARLDDGWDLMIAFPPCTHLANSGARYWNTPRKRGLQQSALEFVRQLLDADIPKIALENPVGKISTSIRKADQTIQPWMFGHGEQKCTCLWLKNLPLLIPTKIVKGRRQRTWLEPPGKQQWRNRSRFLVGIANAMADQWSA